jgi:hypothetical protein
VNGRIVAIASLQEAVRACAEPAWGEGLGEGPVVAYFVGRFPFFFRGGWPFPSLFSERYVNPIL